MNPDFKPYLTRVACFAVLSAATFGLGVGAIFGVNLWRAFFDGINAFAVAYVMVDVWKGKLRVNK